MDSAKASVKKIIGKSGQHDTTVHEQVAPAIQRETVNQTTHEKTIPAVDREVHQTHYHTTEQPVLHKETLPEIHHHQELPVEKREFRHGKDEEVKRSLDAERSQYRDTSTRVEGEQTRSTEPMVAGEHIHHHVHETIQPVIHKETIEPHVVHKTVPIHEVHHNEAKHHTAHSLPPVSMDEFKRSGGSLKGREERQDFFPGEPKSFPGENGMTGKTTGVAMDGHGTNPMQSNVNTSQLSSGSTTTGTTSSTGAASKPGLMDRLNPKKDADGDGQAGFMK